MNEEGTFARSQSPQASSPRHDASSALEERVLHVEATGRMEMLQRNYSNFPPTAFVTDALPRATLQQSQQQHLSSSQMIMTRRIEAAKNRAQQLHVAAEGRGTLGTLESSSIFLL
jgi:hypothetical protein